MILSEGAERGADWLRLRIGRRLEAGGDAPVLRWPSAVWARFADVTRPLELPTEAPVVGVAGPLLGGSGVTPLVRAIALELAARGRRVVVVARGYRGRSAEACWVLPDASAREVGDEPVELARALSGHPVRIVAGGTLASRLQMARRGSDVIIVDGLLQTTPRRLALSVLSLSGPRPWGSGRCPPLGDLRARRDRLASATDCIVHAGAEREAMDPFSHIEAAMMRPGAVRFARAAGGLPLGTLKGMRLGVVLGIARPERVLGSLRDEGLRVACCVRLGDHAGAVTFRAEQARASRESVDCWVTTSKCATKLGDTFAGRPLGVLGNDIEVPAGLRSRLLSAVGDAPVGKGAG